MPPEQRREFLSRYVQSTREIARRFVDSASNDLFETGLPADTDSDLDLSTGEAIAIAADLWQAKQRLRNLPCRAITENNAWLEVVLTAVDLICWTKTICFAEVPALARCEIAAFRYRVLHVAARITRGARRLRLRIDKTWRWAAQIAEGFHRLRAAFT